MIDKAVSIVDEARINNPKCTGGLLIHPFTHALECGPFGGAELLTLLYADDAYFGYFYGHVLQHPDPSNGFVALLVRSEKLMNATTVPLLFHRFHYWMTIHHEYKMLAIPDYDSNDAYSDKHSFADAAETLAKMIQSFDLEKFCSQPEDEPYDGHPLEMRIVDIYGTRDLKHE